VAEADAAAVEAEAEPSPNVAQQQPNAPAPASAQARHGNSSAQPGQQHKHMVVMSVGHLQPPWPSAQCSGPSAGVLRNVHAHRRRPASRRGLRHPRPADARSHTRPCPCLGSLAAEVSA
jgi:hypothetical protein